MIGVTPDLATLRRSVERRLRKTFGQRTKPRLIVYTSIIGGRHFLKDPSVITPDCRYICFTDQPFQSEVWEIVRVPSSDDPRKASRYYKMKPHMLFDADYSFWIDSCARINVDVRQLIWRYMSRGLIAAFAHAELDCVYELAEENITAGRERDPATVRRHLSRFRSAGLPEHAGVWNCSALLRRHTREIRALNDAWWGHLEAGFDRDEPSFGYLTWKLGIPVATIPGHWLQSGELERLHIRVGRQRSEFDPAEWSKLVAPSSVADCPADLHNTALEYDGVHNDGWLDDSVFFGLRQPPASGQLVVRGMIPLVNDPAFNTELEVLVDDRTVARRTLGLGDFEVRAPVQEAAGRRSIRFYFSNGQVLPRDWPPRRVTAHLRFVGFEPADSEVQPTAGAVAGKSTLESATTRDPAPLPEAALLIPSGPARRTSVCFCTLAIHPQYRQRALRLCAGMLSVPWVVLTDEPEDFATLPIRALKHAPTGPMAVDYLASGYLAGQSAGVNQRGAAAYHDKRFALLAALSGFDTALYVDADARFTALPPLPAFSPGLAVVRKGGGSIAEHLDAFGQWRKPHFAELATYLMGSADILHQAWWCDETLVAVTRDGRESRFFAAWSLAASFMQSRGVYSGEGGVIGLAAAYAGWQVDFDALRDVVAVFEHEGGGPKRE